MSFKNLDVSKIQISEPKTKKIKNEYKGNVYYSIEITDHVLERFAQRWLNNASFNLSQIKEHLQQLIFEKGIIGFTKGDQSFVALPTYGLFIIRNIKAVTFIGLNDINPYYRNIYIKLLNKGRVD